MDLPHWGFKEAVNRLVHQIRAEVLARAKSATISQQQKATLKEPLVKGPTRVSKFTLPPPYEDHVRALLSNAIDGLNDGYETYGRP